jgi:hypothetical protein
MTIRSLPRRRRESAREKRKLEKRTGWETLVGIVHHKLCNNIHHRELINITGTYLIEKVGY